MKTRLIASAAALACPSAYCQTSTVTLYGVMDAAYARAGGDVSHWSGGVCGRNIGSRIGFKRSEDLGGGLKANFVLEGDLRINTGTGETTPRAGWSSIDNKWARPAAACSSTASPLSALSCGFGELTFGATTRPCWTPPTTRSARTVAHQPDHRHLGAA